MGWFFGAMFTMLFGLGFYIDWRRKKINNHPFKSTHPHSKPGEDSNYRIGDNNNHSDGGMG